MNTDEAAAAVTKMWEELGRSIVESLPERVKEGDSLDEVVRAAACAEACFWQATGEGDSPSVKDLWAHYVHQRDEACPPSSAKET